MNARPLVVATLIGTVVLFLWQTISNAVIPWHTATMKPFADTTSIAARVIMREAPTNGVYYSPYGVLAAVAITPDMADKSKMMGPMLGRQIPIDLAVVVALCLLAARLRNKEPLDAAFGAMMAGLAGSIVLQLSDWNWYGFAPPYALVNIADTAIGFFITGFAIGWIAWKMAPAPTTTA